MSVRLSSFAPNQPSSNHKARSPDFSLLSPDHQAFLAEKFDMLDSNYDSWSTRDSLLLLLGHTIELLQHPTTYGFSIRLD